MRRIVKGEEVIILSEDGYGGFTSIATEKLTKKMEELFTDEALNEIATDFPPGFRKMTLIAVIKSDIGNKDSMGWKQHKAALQEEGFIEA